MLKICAVKDTILIKPIYFEKIGSIIVPDIAKKEHSAERALGVKGEVIAIGSDYKNNLKPGDIAIFNADEGFPVMIDEIEYLCVKEKWVVGREEEICQDQKGAN